jgi:Domain of unknown function (DUF2382)
MTHRADEHEVVRWCRLLSEAAIPADPTQLDLPAPSLPSVLAEARGATVVHPGAADAARRWPAERVRLRKVLVTDHVTKTVPVRREAIRLETDPPPKGEIEHVEDVPE